MAAVQGVIKEKFDVLLDKPLKSIPGLETLVFVKLVLLQSPAGDYRHSRRTSDPLACTTARANQSELRWPALCALDCSTEAVQLLSDLYLS